MTQKDIKSCFSSAVRTVASSIFLFTDNPGDLTRERKLPPGKLLTFLVSQGSSSTKNELLDFFDMDPLAPSPSALNQQRDKLSPDALEAVFRHFNSSLSAFEAPPDYRFIAADGSTFTFFSRPCFAPEDYHVCGGHSSKGFYSMHLNAFYDLHRHTYTDALIQPAHKKDEFRAFCDMVDRYGDVSGTKAIFTGDRGYCSYNNMAHVINKGQFFLFRSKDIRSKGLLHNFDFPDGESFDITVKVSLVRSHSRRLPPADGYRRFVGKAASFDFIEYGSLDTYDISFRVIRFPLSGSSYECIVTNLPAKEFPPERIREIYFMRWGIESSFRKLKYTIGLSNFHSYKPGFIMQEIWAKLIHYNITETMVSHTVISQGDTKHDYVVNFSVAAHVCRAFLRPCAEKRPIDVMSLLKKELLPVRNERQYPRLQTAHFRKPRYFLYRAA